MPAGRRPAPRLGLSFEGRPVELLAAAAPYVDVVEVLPDCLVARDGDRPEPRLLAALDEHVPGPLTYHGIGLSLGTATGWNEDYLRLLESTAAWREPLWHSEHLGWTTVDGSFLGTMPALPTSPEARDLVVARAQRMRELFGWEFLLEHVASPLRRTGDLRPADWLNQISRATGDRLLVDLHNLECDVDNGLLDLDDFVDELDWSRVGEIHLAGGIWQDGLHLDVHARAVAPSTLALLDRVLPRCTSLELVVFEVLAEAVPRLGTDVVCEQLATVRRHLEVLPCG